MNKKWLLPFLAAFTLLTGCVLRGGSTGDVTFTWTFNGADCSALPADAIIQITIPGEALANGGQYACLNGGYNGIQLLSFAPGTYNYTIDALDSTGTQQLATASGSFVVNGNVSVPVDLTLLTGDITLAWTFPNSVDCAGAAITAGSGAYAENYVDYTIDSSTVVRVTCSAGDAAHSAAVALTGLASGTHTITMQGVYATSTSTTTDPGFQMYYATGNFSVTSGTSTPVSVNLGYAVGGAYISWDFWTGSAYENCAAAGDSYVFINFRDHNTGAVQYGTAGDPTTWATEACGFNSQSAFYPLPQLAAGDHYDVLVEGIGGTPSSPTPPYWNDYGVNNTASYAPPAVTVVAGQFPQSISDATYPAAIGNAILLYYP